MLLDQFRGLEKGEKISPTPEQNQKFLWLKARQAHLGGNFETALKTYQRLLTEDPLHGEALLVLGDLYRETGKLEKALLSYERAARISGMEADGLIRQAQIEVERERYKNAVDLLEVAQSFRPQSHVSRYLEQVRRLAH